MISKKTVLETQALEEPDYMTLALHLLPWSLSGLVEFTYLTVFASVIDKKKKCTWSDTEKNYNRICSVTHKQYDST